MRSRKIIIGLLFFSVCFFLLGYFRNYIFLSLNERASALYYNSPSPPLNGILSIFKSFSYDNILTAKWVLTFLFIAIYGIFTAIVIYFAYRKSTYVYLSLAGYFLLCLLSIIFAIAGKIITPFSRHGFNISRSLAHIGQSPVIIIIIFLGIYYYNEKNKH